MEIVHGRIKGPHLLQFNSGWEMYVAATNHVNAKRHSELTGAWSAIVKSSQSEITPLLFMREFTWAVYVSGWSARVISAKFKAILESHHIESDGRYIPPDGSNCFLLPGFSMGHIFQVFRNKAKATAVQRVRLAIWQQGWPAFHACYVKDRDPVKLGKLPFMGPALSCHLARNLGNTSVVKPDKHLKRLATHYGYESPDHMCRKLDTTRPPAMVDLTLWLAAIDCGTA